MARIATSFTTLLVAATALALPASASAACGVENQFTRAKAARADSCPPVAAFSFSPTLASPGQTIDFDATASADPDGVVTEYRWDWTDDGSWDVTSGSPLASHSFPTHGAYTVRLQVSSGGDTDTLVHTVSVSQAPNASVTRSPASTGLNEPVSFDASASSDPEGGQLTYEWDWNNDGTYDFDSAADPTVTHAYAANGSYTVKLRVTDPDGATDTTTTTVSAFNLVPLVSMNASKLTTLVGSVVIFTASATDADGLIAAYDWDLDGNGSFESVSLGPIAARAYPNAGTIQVSVRARDDDGGSAFASRSIEVTDPATGGGGGSGGGTGGGTGGTKGGGTKGGGSTGGGSSSLAASLGGKAIQKLKKVASGGVRLSVTANRAGTAKVKATISAKDARKLKLSKKKKAKKPVLVASGTLKVVAGKAGKLTLKLKKAARKRVKRYKRRVMVTVKGTYVDASGRKVALSRVVLLKR